MSINYREAIVHMALSQLGVEESTGGDDKYIEFYNSITGSSFCEDGTPWCAIFVSYCARHVDIPTSMIPNFASCTVSRDDFWKPKGRWVDRVNADPQPGDIIYFDWAGTRQGDCDHVGIVVDVTSSDVTTVEGNTTGDSCIYGVRRKTYPKNWSQIIGYGVPNYDGTDYIPGNSLETDNTITNGIKVFQKWINQKIDAGLVIDGSYGPLTKTASIKVYQMILNNEYCKNLAVDGSFGPATKAAAVAIQQGYVGNLAYCAQGMLYTHDVNPEGFDGSFGPGMYAAIKSFQEKVSIDIDGSCGPVTWYNLYTNW